MTTTAAAASSGSPDPMSQLRNLLSSIHPPSSIKTNEQISSNGDDNVETKNHSPQHKQKHHEDSTALPFQQEQDEVEVVVVGKEDVNVSESNDWNPHSIIRYGESLVLRSVLTYKNISCKSKDDERGEGTGEDEENVLYQGKME